MSNYDELLSKMTRKSGDKDKSNESKDSKEQSRDRSRNRRKRTDSSNESDDGSEKFAPTIDREEIDYYRILGVDEDASAKQIKRAYYKRLKKYQPDKIKDKTDKEAVRKNKEKYKLINESYNVLKDEFKRKAYDTGKKFEVSHSKGIDSQKNSFKEFIKLQEQNMTDEDKNLAKLKFEMSKKELNAKHGYDESKEEAIEEAEFGRRVDDYDLQRQQEEAGFEHDNMFEGRQFNPSEFNKAFERKKKRDAKRSKNTAGGIVPVGGEDGIMAFNDGMDSNFASIDAYNDLYAGGSFAGTSDNFAGIGSGMIGGEGSDSDDISIDSADIEDTYDTHNQGISKESMDDMMQRAMAERDMQDKKFEDMDIKEFGSAMDDKYGISKDFGFMVGNDSKFGGHQVGRKGRRGKKNGDKSSIQAQYEAYKELTEN
jgi:curved DNA-binding protein CbpA